MDLPTIDFNSPIGSWEPPVIQRGLTSEQYATLMKPLNSTRVAKRQVSGKNLSYLEAFDVRAHLIRIFGFTNFDVEVTKSEMLYQRDIEVGRDKNPGWEVAWHALVRLTIRDQHGYELCTYTEGAVGSAVGSVNLGDLHDNAIKQAASDGMKRCATNLGTQFGLSLYDDGNTRDVVKGTLIGGDAPEPKTEEQIATLAHSLGATVVNTETPDGAT